MRRDEKGKRINRSTDLSRWIILIHEFYRLISQHCK